MSLVFNFGGRVHKEIFSICRTVELVSTLIYQEKRLYIPEVGGDSDLFGLAPIWSGRPAPLCIGCGSGDFAAGAAWI